MGTYSRETTELAVDMEGLGQQHRATEGGMNDRVRAVEGGPRHRRDVRRVPTGSCQEPHWGYMLEGQITIRYDDGMTDVLTAGQAYHIRPGHNAHVDDDCDLVEFTRDDDTPGINTMAV